MLKKVLAVLSILFIANSQLIEVPTPFSLSTFPPRSSSRTQYGGLNDLSGKYQLALNAIYASYPQTKALSVQKVKQTISNFGFIVGNFYDIDLFSNETNGIIQQSFSIYVQISGYISGVTRTKNINLRNYTETQLNQQVEKSATLYPILQNMTLFQANSIWQDGSGLHLGFKDSERNIKNNYVYTLNGQVNNLIF